VRGRNDEHEGRTTALARAVAHIAALRAGKRARDGETNAHPLLLRVAR
jgi:hypothetical protein